VVVNAHEFLPGRQAMEKYMEHNHGSEYQVKTVRRDGTEELSGWMNSETYSRSAHRIPSICRNVSRISFSYKKTEIA
jgi:hypothetical protein